MSADLLPITCVITTHNDLGTIEATIGSVLRQSQPPAEILVADDASTDGTSSLLVGLAARYPTVRLVTRPRNLGVAANRDLAVRAASQPFVTHVDSDDLMTRGKLAAEWDALGGREDAVAYSRIAHIVPRRPWRWTSRDPAETVGPGSTPALSRLLGRTGAIPRDMLLSRRLYEDVGGFSHAVTLYEDWDFKLRLAATGCRWFASGTLGTLYVKRSGSLSTAQRQAHVEAMSMVVLRNLTMLVESLGAHVVAVQLASLFGPELEGMPEHIRREVADRLPLTGSVASQIPSRRGERLLARASLLRDAGPLLRTIARNKTADGHSS